MYVAQRLRGFLWRAVARGGAAAQRAAQLVSAGGALGVKILVDPHEPAKAASIAKVGAAIALIAERDPRRFRRFGRDVSIVALVSGGYLGRANGAYLPGSRTCYLRTAVVDRYSATNVAILLVHEATHARLDHLRAVAWWPPLRYRMEHRCLLEEVAFVDRLPRGEYPSADDWRADRLRRSRFALPGPRRERTAARVGHAI